jgi:hypothetical protein
MSRRNKLSHGAFGTFASLAIACVVVDCSAQVTNFVRYGQAIWTYEGSVDGGSTWQRGLIEAVPGATVQVRALGFFDRATPSCYYGSTFYDAQITNASLDDSVSRLGFGQLLYNIFLPSLNVQRFPNNTLKIDFATDIDPPGVGSRWLSPGQPHPSATIANIFDNPLLVMSFDYQLDMTEGDRVISNAFRRVSFPGLQTDEYLTVYDSLDFFTLYAEPIRQEPLTLRVVPAPGSASILLIGMVLGSRRRSY